MANSMAHNFDTVHPSLDKPILDLLKFLELPKLPLVSCDSDPTLRHWPGPGVSNVLDLPKSSTYRSSLRTHQLRPVEDGGVL